MTDADMLRSALAMLRRASYRLAQSEIDADQKMANLIEGFLANCEKTQAKEQGGQIEEVRRKVQKAEEQFGEDLVALQARVNRRITGAVCYPNAPGRAAGRWEQYGPSPLAAHLSEALADLEAQKDLREAMEGRLG